MFEAVILSDDHPYVIETRSENGMWLWHRKDGRWEVRCRDIHTVKQEKIFDTEIAARAWMLRHRLCCHILLADEVGGSLEEALDGWHERYMQKLGLVP